MFSFTVVVPAFIMFSIVVLTAIMLRRVVPTNEVHIVQTKKTTLSYGKDTKNGNVYYEWPSFLPLIGITKTSLPVSNFDIPLNDYEAYDEGRLPFLVDIMAFFRVKDPNTAAQRVSSFSELRDQLKSVVQGAARSILASNNIEKIMQGRSEFGQFFTDEVSGQLNSWGVETVKNIELMDIRDSKDSKVIQNIMEKKKSEIEAESRTAVANNNRNARLAEIEADREIELRDEDKRKSVGERKIEVDLQLNKQTEVASQTVNAEKRTTAETEMEIKRVQDVQSSEIAKSVRLVKADEDRQAKIIDAEAQRDQIQLVATGKLEEARRDAEGIQARGLAEAEAEKAKQLAPVRAQIELAQEIGENNGYQHYLISIRKIEAEQEIGIAQAVALQAADVKVIATSDSGSNGLSSVGDVVTARGGTQLGAMIEAARQVPAVDNILSAAGVKSETTHSPTNGV